jgi:hypothetical protein
MRGVALALGRLAQLAAGRIARASQRAQSRPAVHMQEQAVRIGAAETASAKRTHLERRDPDGGERLIQLLGERLAHLAHKPQRDMQRLARAPLRARNAALDGDQPGGDLVGNWQGGKQAQHGGRKSNYARLWNKEGANDLRLGRTMPRRRNDFQSV